jgi:hypothetical protein
MDDSKGERPSAGWLIGALFGVVLTWAVSGLILYGSDERGTFGDMFGAVNALFSGLAFATLIYTAWMQRIELALQRDELAATRDELAGQRAQMKEQSDTLKLQRFENTFFSLLAVHGQLVDSLRLPMHGESREGRDCFYWWYELLREQNQKHGVYPPGGELEGFRNVYERFYSARQAGVGHYFRNLYHIIKFVKVSPIANKRQYVEEFALLENMPSEGLFMFDRLRSLYLPGAFGTDGL